MPCFQSRRGLKKDATKKWSGKGQATAGATKKCTKVHKYYFGKIPGTDVGMAWQFRSQVRAADVGCASPNFCKCDKPRGWMNLTNICNRYICLTVLDGRGGCRNANKKVLCL